MGGAGPEVGLIHAATGKPVDAGNPLPTTSGSGSVVTETNSAAILAAVLAYNAVAGSVTDPGSVALIGLRAESTVPAAVPDGSPVNAQADLYGRIVPYGADRSQGAQGIVNQDPLAAKSGYEQLLDVTLDDSTTTDGSAAFFIGDKDKVTFLIITDITVVTDTPTATYTIDLGPTAAGPWVTCDVLLTDDGYDSPQAEVAQAADVGDVAYLPDGVTAQYLKGRVVGTDTGPGDTAACDLFLLWKKG